ncbi:peptidoglycan-binding domain-containing protein [Leptospira sp. 96542]|nr:peptidoglycan-binding domain-containing protein [Leptospira sp. 96542]
MATTYPTLRQGSTGAPVSFLQRNLIALGYESTLSPEGADGVFGSKTNKAVRDFQLKHGLAVDGIVGENTWGKLLSLVPSSEILVNTIQSTVQLPPVPTSASVPPPSLPTPPLPNPIEVRTEQPIKESKGNSFILYGLIGVGAYLWLGSGKKRRR